MDFINSTAFLFRASSCYVRGSLPLRLPEEPKWNRQLARSLFPKTFSSDFQRRSNGKISSALDRDTIRTEPIPKSHVCRTGAKESLFSKLRWQWLLGINSTLN